MKYNIEAGFLNVTLGGTLQQEKNGLALRFIVDAVRYLIDIELTDTDVVFVDDRNIKISLSKFKVEERDMSPLHHQVMVCATAVSLIPILEVFGS